jgi:hypothetical protein
VITKQTIIDQIEITRYGSIQIRFAKVVVEDDQVLVSEYHRTSIEPGGDIQAQMDAVNAHLTGSLKAAPVIAKDIAYINAIAGTAWTPEVVAAWRAKQAAAAKLNVHA